MTSMFRSSGSSSSTSIVEWTFDVNMPRQYALICENNHKSAGRTPDSDQEAGGWRPLSSRSNIAAILPGPPA